MHHESARFDPASLDEDAPTRVPMAPRGIDRRKPSTDQKSTRRKIQLRTASQEETIPMKTTEREVQLLQAMAKASPAEQVQILAELDEIRAQRTVTEGGIDFSSTRTASRLAAVPTHSPHTSATDWLATAASAPEDPTVAHHAMRTEATMWFQRLSAAVIADREEFAEQAMGMALVKGSQYGEESPAAQRTFLDTVARLHRLAETQSGNADSGLPLAPPQHGYGDVEDGVLDTFQPPVAPENAAAVAEREGEGSTVLPIVQENQQETPQKTGHWVTAMQAGDTCPRCERGQVKAEGGAPVLGTPMPSYFACDWCWATYDSDGNPTGTLNARASLRTAAEHMFTCQECDRNFTAEPGEVYCPGCGGEQVTDKGEYKQAARRTAEITGKGQIVTEDGQDVNEGDRVFNYYDMKWGTIANVEAGDDPWFDVMHEDGTKAYLNGARISTFDPREKNPHWPYSGPPRNASQKVAGNPFPVGTPNWFRWEQEPDFMPETRGPRSGGGSEKERLFPNGIPLHGDLTPEQQAWLDKRGSKTAEADQSGEAESSLPDVQVAGEGDRPMWPWELDEQGKNDPGAADVAGTHTPGQSVGDYPQPKGAARKVAFVTITREWTGKPTEQYVVRQFGDQFLDSFETEAEAEEYAASIGHSVGTPDSGTEGGWPFKGSRTGSAIVDGKYPIPCVVVRPRGSGQYDFEAVYIGSETWMEDVARNASESEATRAALEFAATRGIAVVGPDGNYLSNPSATASRRTASGDWAIFTADYVNGMAPETMVAGPYPSAEEATAAATAAGYDLNATHYVGTTLTDIPVEQVQNSIEETMAGSVGFTGRRRTAIKVRDMVAYETTCPNQSCSAHGVSFVRDDLFQGDDDEAECPECETPLIEYPRPATASRRTASGGYWVNDPYGEGSPVAIGPFATEEIANTFRAMAFASPTHGEVSQTPVGQKMTVSEFQSAFRADLNPTKGTPPAGGWHAKTASGETCATCGDSIARDPEGEANRTWHHTNGTSHDHEAKPSGGSKESRRRISVKIAGVALTNVTIVDRASRTFKGRDGNGNTVTFQANEKDAADLFSVMFGDLAGNFSGVTIDESEIIDDSTSWDSDSAAEAFNGFGRDASRRTAAPVVYCTGMPGGCGGTSTDIAMIDREGYVYCESCGQRRKPHVPTRKLKPAEIEKIKSGRPLNSYNGSRIAGVYDDVQWQWVSDSFGPMGWFSDAEKAEHEGTPDFSAGHWIPVGQADKDSMSAWYTEQASAQASRRTAGVYCKTHDVWVGDGNASTHTDCSKEQRATDKTKEALQAAFRQRVQAGIQRSANDRAPASFVVIVDGQPVSDEDGAPFVLTHKGAEDLRDSIGGGAYVDTATAHNASRRPFVREAMPSPAELNVAVGDIFYGSWGYDQTNVNFYEVVGLTGASVKVREVGKRQVSDSGPSVSVMPDKGNYIGPEMTKRLKSGYRGQAAIRINEVISAWAWDGQPKSETGYGWGH